MDLTNMCRIQPGFHSLPGFPLVISSTGLVGNYFFTVPRLLLIITIRNGSNNNNNINIPEIVKLITTVNFIIIRLVTCQRYTPTHPHTHTRTHARTHTHSHTHTYTHTVLHCQWCVIPQSNTWPGLMTHDW